MARQLKRLAIKIHNLLGNRLARFEKRSCRCGERWVVVELSAGFLPQGSLPERADALVLSNFSSKGMLSSITTQIASLSLFNEHRSFPTNAFLERCQFREK